jgi:hypothetical protein
MRLIKNLHNEARIPGVKIAVPAAVIVLIATATLASFHWRRTVPTVTVASTLVQQRASLDAQRITLRPTGFEPAEVMRPAGRFLLAINDRSGRPDTVFILMRETGERLKEMRLRETPRKNEWREVVNLPPGRYVLLDAADREHVCHILLTN